ncbi:MAG: ester cyclase [Anaerolineae bacterium]|nr:ester cyclase [Anaerolineae bacterium]
MAKEPTSKPVTTIANTDISKLMNPGTELRQPMQGFDPDYVDIVDYIIRCTHKIWEEGAAGLVYTHYSHHAAIHTADGFVYGREDWVTHTVQAQAAFPDRRPIAHDVIWTGNDQDGYYTSHLVRSMGTNTGYTEYGPPTGRRVARWGMANCVVKENYIVAEWVMGDQMAVIMQMGYDPYALARELAQQPPPPGARKESYGEIERLQGELPPPGLERFHDTPTDIEDLVRTTLHELWNLRLFNRVHERYVENYTCFTVPNRYLYGRGEYRTFVTSMIAAFPDARLFIDHLCWLDDGNQRYRVACRWNLVGTHLGPSKYGKPTGKRVRILGTSHFHIHDGKFVHEYCIFDEFALLKQLFAPD